MALPQKTVSFEDHSLLANQEKEAARVVHKYPPNHKFLIDLGEPKTHPFTFREGNEEFPVSGWAQGPVVMPLGNQQVMYEVSIGDDLKQKISKSEWKNASKRSSVNSLFSDALCTCCRKKTEEQQRMYSFGTSLRY